MKYVIIALLAVVSVTAQGQQTKSQNVYYDRNVADINNQQTKELEKLISPNDSIIKVEINAYADSEGKIEANRELSARRANAIARFYESKGIHPQNIIKKAHGEQFCKESDELKDCRVAQIKLTTIPKPPKMTVEELLQQLRPEPTAFTFDPSLAQEFSTERGTRLSIKPNSFITKNDGDVTLYIDEILDLSDMVIFNLSTTSKGALLETGGMLKITAVQGDDTLSNKLLKNIEIQVLTNDFKPDMRIWNGREHKNGFVDWHLQQNDENGLGGGVSANLDDQILLNGSDYFWRTRYYTLFQRIFRRRWMLADIAANNANLDSINNYNYQENLKELFALGVNENDTLLPNDTGAVASANATAQFGSYLFAAKNIGYLNIDRMSKLNQDQQGPVAVETDDKAANFQLIIKRNKTGFGTSMVNGKPVFQGVPYGSSIYVVGLSTKTGTPRLYLEEFKMNEKLGKVTSQFEEVALEDLKEKLSVLDS